MSEVMLIHQLGLGDYFICNGLVNYFSTKYSKVFLPVKPQNYSTVACLYSSNPRVSVFTINGVVQTAEKYLDCFGIPIIDADVYMHRPSSARWYRWYYEQFELPYSLRFNQFRLPAEIPDSDAVYTQVVGAHALYRVVHDTPSDGRYAEIKSFESSNSELPIVKITPNINPNLLAWTKVLKNATEIHAIDSSVFNLVHSMGESIKARVFYHQTRQSNFTYEPGDILAFCNNVEIV
jgi:hypothetical protein